jgi:taurine dioxygenase
MSQALSIKKLTPSIGATISDIDLSTELSEGKIKSITTALLEYQVLFFRDQDLSIEQQKAFARRFGPLHMHPAPLHILEGHPDVLLIQADGNSTQVAGHEWHSDVSCDPEPPLGSVLYLKEVPSNGGDTLFASMYAAYEALSSSLQRFLCGLTAVHDGARNYEGRRPADYRGSAFPRAEHPVIRTHPATRRRALFVNRMFTTRLTQLKQRESDAILRILFEHIENPTFQCRFKWRPNSVAFWDNRCTQHLALWDYFPERRYGYRVSIAGDKPVYCE